MRTAQPSLLAGEIYPALRIEVRETSTPATYEFKVSNQGDLSIFLLDFSTYDVLGPGDFGLDDTHMPAGLTDEQLIQIARLDPGQSASFERKKWGEISKYRGPVAGVVYGTFLPEETGSVRRGIRGNFFVLRDKSSLLHELKVVTGRSTSFEMQLIAKDELPLVQKLAGPYWETYAGTWAIDQRTRNRMFFTGCDVLDSTIPRSFRLILGETEANWRVNTLYSGCMSASLKAVGVSEADWPDIVAVIQPIAASKDSPSQVEIDEAESVVHSAMRAFEGKPELKMVFLRDWSIRELAFPSTWTLENGPVKKDDTVQKMLVVAFLVLALVAYWEIRKWM